MKQTLIGTVSFWGSESILQGKENRGINDVENYRDAIQQYISKFCCSKLGGE